MDEAFENVDDAVEAFMKTAPTFVDDEGNPVDDQPIKHISPDGDDEADEEVVEQDTQEDDEHEEQPDAEEGEDEGDDPSTQDPDDAEVSVSVDGTEHKVKVKDLKRLYGQEAALTQKSQAVSQQVRAIENQGLYLAQVLDARMKTAQANYDKYGKVDLFKAMRELPADDFDALKAAKEAAEAEYRQVSEESQTFLKRTEETRSNILRQRAKTSLVEIKKAIPEWDDKVYEKVRGYAVSQGMDADSVNEVVDAGAIIMMHKAMLYDHAKAGKDKVTKKVAKTPTRVVTKGEASTDPVSTKLKRLKAAAAQSGEMDDVAELMLLQSRK